MIKQLLDEEIVKYVKKHHKNSIWLWTTVDEHGETQILLYNFEPNTKKYTGWGMIKQKTIRKDLYGDI